MPEFPLAVAKVCMAEYDALMQGDNVQQMHEAFSDTVTFNTRDLAEWLNANKYLENTDSIRICFGVYTAEAARVAGKAENEGRVTVFIVPIRNNEEIDCFNGGHNGP